MTDCGVHLIDYLKHEHHQLWS